MAGPETLNLLMVVRIHPGDPNISVNTSMDWDEIAWKGCGVEDLWLFDKLILARKLGYTCGPVGVDVPQPNSYIVRPVTNLMGMGQGATIVWVDKNTDHLPVGYFWCEVFTGRHLSVDYLNGKQILCTEAFRNSNAPLYRFDRWERTNDVVSYPSILGKIFPSVNCEFIGGNLIEVHLRSNPDWKYNSDVIYPVWEGEDETPPDGMVYVSDPDFKRKGFFINE